MKYKDIKTLSDHDLKNGASELKSQLNLTKFNHALSPLENPMVIRQNRKKVAKFLTELTARKNK
jgi:large subunit ribosomal protein L29